MKTVILTTQSKGQITLPKEWRDEFNTTVFQAVKQKDMIILKPVTVASTEEVKKATKEFITKNKKLLKSLANK
jgi:bifunctional DNA-binding transcriptional regulator/antitoxin component of YhaV-PrlF toxin-antitoxin module